eukprot:684306-Hanusia_phi.AAC.1
MATTSPLHLSDPSGGNHPSVTWTVDAGVPGISLPLPISSRHRPLPRCSRRKLLIIRTNVTRTSARKF